jgi:signal transduction histidine kinase
LHLKSLPLLALVVGATLVILTIFPRFFRVGLVDPLGQLLAGVARVNIGDREVEVPVVVEDEIGRLTSDFNRMVVSLRVSEQRLNAFNLTLEQRVADRTRELATLYEVAAMVINTPVLDTLLQTVVYTVAKTVHGTASMILLASEDERSLHLVAHYGLDHGDIPMLSNSVAWLRVREQKTPWLVHDLSADEQAAVLFPTSFPYASLVGVPIRGNESVLGVFVVLSETPFLFNVEALGLLSAVAEQVGIAIENARLRKQAEAAVVLEERQRLARDLHDSVTQLLYSQTLFADAGVKLLRKGRIDKAEAYVARIGEAAIQALREMRLMIYRLRPAALEQEGLIGALRRRLDMVEMRSHVAVTFTAEGLPPLPPSMAEALYFIAEEALNNALKHANATQVSLSILSEGDDVVLTIVDDGRGFDLASVTSGLGLQSMQERAAQMAGVLVLDVPPEGGVVVTARLPLLVKALDGDGITTS